MKIGFFLSKLPLPSETFVLNQMITFIDMGHDVEIVALQKGNFENTHASFNTYRLGEKTRWPLNEPESKLAKLKYRAAAALHGLTCVATWKALNVACYGEEVCSLISAAICGGNLWASEADVFTAYFGPAGVTVAKLRELGIICGKIVTISHGVDVSHQDVFIRYTLEYQQLLQRGDLMLFISNLRAGRLRNMGCPP